MTTAVIDTGFAPSTGTLDEPFHGEELSRHLLR